jgi:hypothetical protein
VVAQDSGHILRLGAHRNHPQPGEFDSKGWEYVFCYTVHLLPLLLHSWGWGWDTSLGWVLEGHQLWSCRLLSTRNWIGDLKVELWNLQAHQANNCT